MTFNLRRAPGVALIAALAALAAACGGTASPEGWSTPLISDDQLVYFPDKGVLAAAGVDDAGPTSIQWTFPDDSLASEEDLDVQAVYGEPVEADGSLFFAGWEGELYSVDAATGRLRWTTDGQADIDGSIVAGLTLDGDRLFAATTEGNLYAFHTSDGAPAPGWPEDGVDFPKGIWATPVARDGFVYVATMSGAVHALNAADGSPAWSAPFEADTGAIPELALINDSLLFVPTLGKQVYFLNAADGTEAFPSIASADWVWSTPAVRDSMVYFGDFSGVVHAVDITTGTVNWTYDTAHKIKAAPALAGDMLVVGDRGPGVTFIDAASGERRGNRVPIADAGTIRANVVAHDGVAYILTTSGKLFRADPARLAVVQVPVAGAPD